MNEEENFLTIEALSSLIDAKVSGIQKGELKIEMLEQLLDEVRELHERLIIIKYMSIEKLSAENVDKLESESIVEEEIPKKDDQKFVVHKVEEVPENQISLIDSIEEIYEEKAHAEPMDLFGSIGQPIEIVDEKPKVNIPQLQEESKALEERKTLGDKIKNKAIKSIAKSIKLNARIGIIKQLFGGDSEKYKAAIKDLNSADDLVDAKTKFHSFSEEHDWDPENEWYLLLSQLVDRRYI